MLWLRSVFELHNTIQRHLCFRIGRVYGIRGLQNKTCFDEPANFWNPFCFSKLSGVVCDAITQVARLSR